MGLRSGLTRSHAPARDRRKRIRSGAHDCEGRRGALHPRIPGVCRLHGLEGWRCVHSTGPQRRTLSRTESPDGRIPNPVGIDSQYPSQGRSLLGGTASLHTVRDTAIAAADRQSARQWLRTGTTGSFGAGSRRVRAISCRTPRSPGRLDPARRSCRRRVLPRPRPGSRRSHVFA